MLGCMLLQARVQLSGLGFIQNHVEFTPRDTATVLCNRLMSAFMVVLREFKFISL